MDGPTFLLIPDDALFQRTERAAERLFKQQDNIIFPQKNTGG